MRYAILSDIHANLQAWQAVRKDMEQFGVDAVLCLGDVVGYGPDPARVMEEVYAATSHFVLGNHDAAVCNRLDPEIFNDEAKFIVEWTRKALNDAAISFFNDVPYMIAGEDFLLTHAEAAQPDRWDYIYDPDEAVEQFAACDDRLIFFGHTHFPCALAQDRKQQVGYLPNEDFTLNPAHRYLVNVGSTGDPRNGDTRAHYVIWDQETGQIHFRKVPFDVEGYRHALLKSQLPTRPVLFDYLGRPLPEAADSVKSAARSGEALADTQRLNRTINVRPRSEARMVVIEPHKHKESPTFLRMTAEREKKQGGSKKIPIAAAVLVVLLLIAVPLAVFLFPDPSPEGDHTSSTGTTTSTRPGGQQSGSPHTASKPPPGATVLFTADFEQPVVEGFAANTMPSTGWVGSSQGFGSGNRGLNHKGHGKAFDTPNGNQVYLLNYSNSGLTTQEGVLGAIQAGTTYTVTFLAGTPDANGKTTCHLELVAFAPAAKRDDLRNAERNGLVLATAQDLVKSNHLTTEGVLTFTAEKGAPYLGRDLAVRIIKTNGRVMYDAIRVTASGAGSHQLADTSPPPTPPQGTDRPSTNPRTLKLAPITASWIWHEGPLGGRSEMRKTFSLPGDPDRAVLMVVCDDQCTVKINGTQVAKTRFWDEIAYTDVTSHLKAGDNVILVEGFNSRKDAGMLAQLQVTRENRHKIIASDTSWEARPPNGTWAPAAIRAEYQGGSWATVRFDLDRAATLAGVAPPAKHTPTPAPPPNVDPAPTTVKATPPASALPANAKALPVANADFEKGKGQLPDNWSWYNGNESEKALRKDPTAEGGNNTYLWIGGSNGDPKRSQMRQFTEVVIEAGSTYTFTVDLLGHPGTPVSRGVLYMFFRKGGHNEPVANRNDLVAPPNRWVRGHTLQFTGTPKMAGQTVVLGLSAQPKGAGVGFDNVRLHVTRDGKAPPQTAANKAPEPTGLQQKLREVAAAWPADLPPVQADKQFRDLCTDQENQQWALRDELLTKHILQGISGREPLVADVPEPALVLARRTAALLTEAEYRNVQPDLKKLFSQFVKAQPDLRDHPDVKKLIEEAVAISALPERVSTFFAEQRTREIEVQSRQGTHKGVLVGVQDGILFMKEKQADGSVMDRRIEYADLLPAEKGRSITGHDPISQAMRGVARAPESIDYATPRFIRLGKLLQPHMVLAAQEAPARRIQSELTRLRVRCRISPRLTDPEAVSTQLAKQFGVREAAALRAWRKDFLTTYQPKDLNPADTALLDGIQQLVIVTEMLQLPKIRTAARFDKSLITREGTPWEVNALHGGEVSVHHRNNKAAFTTGPEQRSVLQLNGHALPEVLFEPALRKPPLTLVFRAQIGKANDADLLTIFAKPHANGHRSTLLGLGANAQGAQWQTWKPVDRNPNATHPAQAKVLLQVPQIFVVELNSVGALSLWIDGALVHKLPKDDSLKEIGGVLFGSRYHQANPFAHPKLSGLISDLHVYDRLLSDLEKRRLFDTLKREGLITTTPQEDRASQTYSFTPEDP